MIKLSSYINRNNIFISAKNNKNEILKDIVDNLLSNIDKNNNLIKNDIIFDKMLNLDISLGEGYLLHHVKNKNIDNIYMSMCLIDKNSQLMKKNKIKLIIFIILPESLSKQYLTLMAKLSRLLTEKEFVDSIEKLDLDKIYNIILNFE